MLQAMPAQDTPCAAEPEPWRCRCDARIVGRNRLDSQRFASGRSMLIPKNAGQFHSVQQPNFAAEDSVVASASPSPSMLRSDSINTNLADGGAL